MTEDGWHGKLPQRIMFYKHSNLSRFAICCTCLHAFTARMYVCVYMSVCVSVCVTLAQSKGVRHTSLLELPVTYERAACA